MSRVQCSAISVRASSTHYGGALLTRDPCGAIGARSRVLQALRAALRPEHASIISESWY